MALTSAPRSALQRAPKQYGWRIEGCSGRGQPLIIFQAPKPIKYEWPAKLIKLTPSRTGRITITSRDRPTLIRVVRDLETTFRPVADIGVDGRKNVYSLKAVCRGHEVEVVAETVTSQEAFLCTRCVPEARLERVRVREDRDTRQWDKDGQLPAQFTTLLKRCQSEEVEQLISKVASARRPQQAATKARVRHHGHDARMAALQMIRTDRVELDLPGWFGDTFTESGWEASTTTQFTPPAPPAPRDLDLAGKRKAAAAEALMPDLLSSELRDVLPTQPTQPTPAVPVTVPGVGEVDIGALCLDLADLVDLLSAEKQPA